MALRHVAEAEPDPLVRAQPGDVLAVEDDPPRAWRQHAHDGVQQRGLADAVAAHHADQRAGRHLAGSPRTAPGPGRTRRRVASTVSMSPPLAGRASIAVRATVRGRPPGPGGRPAPRATEPSHSSLPSCSTVTVLAKRRRNSMSCSMTTTVWSRAISREQLARPLPLRPGSCRPPARPAAAARGSLDEQHADLQPLPLAVREHPGRPVGQAAPDRWCQRRARPRRRRPTAPARAGARSAGGSSPPGRGSPARSAARRRPTSGRSGRRPAARSRARAGRPAPGRRSATVPAVGLVRPVITSTSVVLPAPLGPMRNRSSPWLIGEIQVGDGPEAVEDGRPGRARPPARRSSGCLRLRARPRRRTRPPRALGRRPAMRSATVDPGGGFDGGRRGSRRARPSSVRLPIRPATPVGRNRITTTNSAP